MNYRTTVLLLLLLGLGVAAYEFAPRIKPYLPWTQAEKAVADEGSLQILKNDLTPEKLTRIEIQSRGNQVTLEKSAGGEWNLPGQWPTRKPETEELVRLLTHLSSRFAPLPVDPITINRSGLERPAVKVTVQCGGTKHELVFAEEHSLRNRFSLPTFLRIDNRPEIIRLGPGLVPLLDRPADYYQQRRIFPSERIVRDAESGERTDRLTGKELDAKGGQGTTYSLDKKQDAWHLAAPVKDRVDPDKLNGLLGAVPDIWAEQFVANPKKDLAEYGLKEPAQSIRVIRDSGDPVTLLVGKQSRMKTRKVMRPAPNMGGPPQPPQQEILHEEYRYAKLDKNDQIFEIKADKLKDVFVNPETLRDPRLARFKPDEVRRLEIKRPDFDLILVKDKDQWRIEKPFATTADGQKATELLDRLADWQARDKDIIDKADAKTYGLEKPAASIKIVVEEEKKDGDKKTKSTREIEFELGKDEAAKAKLPVRVKGWERVNLVDDAAWKLVTRPALAYRNRKIIDSAGADLARIDVIRPGETVTLEQSKGDWKLTSPAAAPADKSKAGILADDLGRLEAVEFVTDHTTPEDLDKKFGLTKPALTAKIAFADAKKPAQTLLVGKSQSDKGDYFAKLAGGTDIFTIRKDIFETLNRDALAYRPLQILQKQPADIHEVVIQKDGPAYTLKRDGAVWKLTGPFDATVKAEQVGPLADELANLKAEKYAAISSKDLAAFGLDKPYLRVTIPASAPPKPEPGKPPVAAKAETILVGKPTPDGKGRYATQGGTEGVWILTDKAVALLDHPALDYLDRNVLEIDEAQVLKIAGKAFTLDRKESGWQVTASPAPAFPATPAAAATFLAAATHVHASRFASYGPKPDLAKYELDKPLAVVTVDLKPGPAGKPQKHTIAIGKRTENGNSDRYALVDSGPGVIVVPPTIWQPLNDTYLAFVDPNLLKLDPARITAVVRKEDNKSLELARKENAWEVKTSSTTKGDTATINELVRELATLKVIRVVAYPAKDMLPYGLDKPSDIITLRGTGPDGKPLSTDIEIGKPTADGLAGQGRFVRVGKGTTVGVLSLDLAAKLLAGPLEYRDRNLVNLADIDRVDLVRGNRKAAFTLANGAWRMTEPVEVATEPEIQDFVNSVSHLRADRLVADSGADLKQYGLENPTARWHFQAKDKRSIDLLIGKPGPGGLIYAKLGSSDVVFLLDAPLSKLAQAEFRSRGVWPAPVDAVQVERLTYGGQESPFTLEKVDNVWRLAGRPDAKVNQELVRETLDALSGLKAARFVSDKNPDLKLPGLEPPQRVIEVQTPTGKRTLLIGRREGESGRYYARIPEGEAGQTVFILGEDDARRIVRTMSDFLKPGTANPQ